MFSKPSPAPSSSAPSFLPSSTFSPPPPGFAQSLPNFPFTPMPIHSNLFPTPSFLDAPPGVDLSKLDMPQPSPMPFNMPPPGLGAVSETYVSFISMLVLHFDSFLGQSHVQSGTLTNPMDHGREASCGAACATMMLPVVTDPYEHLLRTRNGFIPCHGRMRNFDHVSASHDPLLFSAFSWPCSNVLPTIRSSSPISV